MKTELDVIAKLGELSESDRRWILSQLPMSARSRLLSESDAAVPRPASSPPENTTLTTSEEDQIFAKLHRAHPDTVAEVLRNEPTYLAAAFMLISDWPWRVQFLNSLPASQRVEVAELASAIDLTPAMSRALSRMLAEQLDHSVAGPQRTPSRFEALVERIGASRSRRRLVRL